MIGDIRFLSLSDRSIDDTYGATSRKRTLVDYWSPLMFFLCVFCVLIFAYARACVGANMHVYKPAVSLHQYVPESYISDHHTKISATKQDEAIFHGPVKKENSGFKPTLLCLKNWSCDGWVYTYTRPNVIDQKVWDPTLQSISKICY